MTPEKEKKEIEEIPVLISEKEKEEIQVLKEIISKLGQKERAMASGYISALRDIGMIEEDQKAAG